MSEADDAYNISMNATVTMSDVGPTYQLTVTGFPTPEEAKGFKQWLFRVIHDAQDDNVTDFRSLGRAH